MSARLAAVDVLLSVICLKLRVVTQKVLPYTSIGMAVRVTALVSPTGCKMDYRPASSNPLANT